MVVVGCGYGGRGDNNGEVVDPWLTAFACVGLASPGHIYIDVDVDDNVRHCNILSFRISMIFGLPVSSEVPNTFSG